MSTDQTEKYQYLAKHSVAVALRALLQARIHSHFVGYLALCRIARKEGRLADLEFDYREFFETFLHPAGLPGTTPYLLPFRVGVRGGAPFLNRNLAGSYAPSSLRSVAPLTRVATLSRETGRMSLDSSHAAKAKQHLTDNQAIDPLTLAIFLYRDFGIKSEAANHGGLLELFRDEFGFRESVPSEETSFGILFSQPAQGSAKTVLFDAGGTS